MNQYIAAPEIIGSRLNDKVKLASKTDEEISRETGVKIAKFYRWKAGRVPKSCIGLVRLGLALDILPNELFLADWAPDLAQAKLTEDDKRHIVQSVAILAELSPGLEGADRPAALLLGALEGIKQRRRVMENVVPAGSKARVDDEGAVLLEPPPANSRFSPVANEDAAVYGEGEQPKP